MKFLALALLLLLGSEYLVVINEGVDPGRVRILLLRPGAGSCEHFNISKAESKLRLSRVLPTI